jgi:hypothetical protein
MQVIRNKGGYVIRVTNVEWRVLTALEFDGRQTAAEQNDDGAGIFEGPEKTIFTQIENGSRPWMQVTEDRRK